MVVSSEWKGNLTEISKMKSKVGGRGAVGGVSLLSFVWDAFSVFHFTLLCILFSFIFNLGLVASIEIFFSS